MSEEMDKNDSLKKTGFGGNTAATKIFHINEILENILKYAIDSNYKQGKLCSKMVRNLRLVKRSWRDTITRLLRKAEGTVITLTLDDTNSIAVADDAKKSGQLLDNFIQTFYTSNRRPNTRLPLKLVLNPDYFRTENFRCLMEFFTQCGNELKELEVNFPRNGGSMPLSFRRLSLPLLRELIFNFSDENAKNPVADALTPFGDNRSGLWFLQEILNASPNLMSFVLPFLAAPEITIPEGFQYIQLPANISSIYLSARLSSDHLKLLLQNILPNLSYLKILIHRVPFQNGLLFEILQRFRKTLTSLTFDGLSSNGHAHTLFRFPLMEKLKFFETLSSDCELGPGDSSTLPSCLPKLEGLFLTSNVEIIKRNWLTTSIFGNVTDIYLCCINDHVPFGNEAYYVSLCVPIMTMIHKKFPNITHLSLCVNLNDMSGLKYLLQNMNQIRVLRLIVQGNWQDIGACSDNLTAILVGLPVMLVSALRQHQELLQNFELYFDIKSSVRNLTNLHTLHLWTEATYNENDMSMVTNLLFGEGFLKMPKLRNLHLHSKFKPSPNMMKEWMYKKLGCRLYYYTT